MVGFKAASMAVLLGSAVLTSAAAVPKEQDNAHAKRLWRGRLGARGPWRDESVKRGVNDDRHYLINIDLSGDGPHQNGIGDLVDINSRDVHEIHERSLLDTPFDPKTGDEKKKAMEKWHFGTNGKSKPSKGGKGKREWEEFESVASSAGVQQGDIDAAKQAASDNLTPEQQMAVMNAVKKAVWDSRKHGERSFGAVPGPAFLFRARDVEEEEKEEHKDGRETMQSLLSVGAKINILGDAPEGETGVMSTESGTKYGVPLVVAGAKRGMGEEMEGAPGYIDITSPVFESSAQRIASLVLSTSNDTSSNSSFVLNASSNIRTQVYLVPIKSDSTVKPGSAAPASKGDLIKVNLKVPVFVADTATVEPYCATFDPSPDAPSPMTVEPCDDVSGEMPKTESANPASASAAVGSDKSQVFLFDPETGVVKPDWTGTSSASAASAQSAEDEVEDEPHTSSVAPPTSTTPAASTSADAWSSASNSAVPTSADFAAKAAETSSLSSLASVPGTAAPTPSAPSTPTTPTSPASSTPVEAYPSETSSIPELPRLSSGVPQAMAVPSSYVHTASAPAGMLAHPSASAIASAASSIAHAAPSNPVPMPVQPSVSAAISHPASSAAAAVPTASAPVSVPVASASKPAAIAAAAGSSAPASSASHAASVAAPSASMPANQANNVTLIFSPSQASVLSENKNETTSALNLSPDQSNSDMNAASAPLATDDTEEQGDAEAMSIPSEFTDDNAHASSAPAETYDPEYDAETYPSEAETNSTGASSMNSPASSGMVARSHFDEDDCEEVDAESVHAKAVSTKSTAGTTKPKAKLGDGQSDGAAGETKKISLGKGGVAVEDAGKLKEESAKAKSAGVQSDKAAKAMSGRLGARFLRRQQTVLKAEKYDTAPYE